MRNFIFSLYFLQLEIKKWRKPNDQPKIKFKYKLGWNSLLGSWIIDNKLIYDSEIQNENSNRLDKIYQCTEVFAVTDRKTRHIKIP